MKTLLTGAGGFVGRYLTPMLDWIDHPVEEPFAVIHLGARTKKKSGKEMPEEAQKYFVENVDRTKMLLNSLEKASVTHFLYVSTIDALHPQNAYAESKKRAEELCRDWAKARRIPFCIARLTQLYGPGEGKYEKIIPVLIRNALAGKTTGIKNDGRSERDFLYVEDAARAIKLLSESHAEGVYSVASGQTVSIRQVVAIIQSILPHTRVVYEPFEKRDRQSVSIKRITALGFVPGVALKDGLLREIDTEKHAPLLQ